jgi:hypothetical protein
MSKEDSINRNVNEQLKLHSTKKEKEVKMEKNQVYQELNVKNNILCMLYELIFLLTVMSFTPRNYNNNMDNIFVKFILRDMGFTIGN